MPEKITAAGGVVFQVLEEQIQVLLIYRNGVWDLPKGKRENDESIPMCAAREVAEETNTVLPIVLGSLGSTFHEYHQKGIHFGKTTLWFSMVFPRAQKLSPQMEEGIELIEWVELEDSIQKVGFENLREVLKRFKKWME